MFLKKLPSGICSLVCLVFPPSMLKNMLLSLLGWRVSRSARIGFCMINARSVLISRKAVISSFNFIRADSIYLGEEALILSFNRFWGYFHLKMAKAASIGRFNKFTAPRSTYLPKPSVFRLGQRAHITAEHYFDLCDSIWLGRNALVAGRGSQFWTHSYKRIHGSLERYRSDGKIIIGKEAVLGSRVILLPCTHLGAGCYVSAGATVKGCVNPGEVLAVFKNSLPSHAYFGRDEHISFKGEKYGRRLG